MRARLSLSVATPAGARRLDLPHVTERRIGRGAGHAWEQFELPRALGDAWLVNPCNTGPLAVRRSLTILHDAQVWQTPQAYGRAFRLWYRLLLPLLGRRSALVSTVSRFSKGELERFGVVPPGKIVVAPNGCDHIDRIAPDPTILARSGLAAGRYFLAIGSLSPHKNIATLLKAEALRARRDLPIVLAGGANPRIFSGTGLEGETGVRHLGRVSDGELRALYEGATALLFPSFFEGFGLPPLEAMRCGCPVIASTAPAVVESCGEAALYADPHDPSAFAARMDELAGDEALRARLAAAGRRQSDGFTWARTAERLLDALLDGGALAPAPAGAPSPVRPS
ncbi:mannosyltransferase [Aureimonas endophytica]|uniref:Mannosyltransferase n=1 Tax=Aureimonas endophytica TaxID=2027858 RepID=A0A917E1U2_9HYPH|nr:mannosyltransferase [Aureimonas endophytica]